MASQCVYFFGGGQADGDATMKNLLGGKGANLADMARIGIPVPAGFTVTTEVCSAYYKHHGRIPVRVTGEYRNALKRVEGVMGKTFGDTENPLLLSVRSGARQSMPGMMDTVLNVGLCSKTLPGLIAASGDARFAYDAYRRLISMYADVVMEKAAGREPAEGPGIREKLELRLERLKKARSVTEDTELSAEDLCGLCTEYKAMVKDTLGIPFPDNAMKQLEGSIKAVFQSWNGKRAITYRRVEGIPDDWGTAVNVQAMVFGNLGDTSATGVAFTRNPANGRDQFYGEWLVNAQGEDVVAGTRTPLPLNKASKSGGQGRVKSMEEMWPKTYKKLVAIRNKLEKHYTDMQDIEFTVEKKELWMLQTRTGKRTGSAAVRMAVEMVEQKLISNKTALLRVNPKQIEELLHPVLDVRAEKRATLLATGLPAGPGAGVGQVVFTAGAAEAWKKRGEKVILVRNETSPEDVHGMHAAQGILTAKGGMTSHAALVARGWGKCCIVGCAALEINAERKECHIGKRVLKEGDWVSMNGTTGSLFEGVIAVMPAQPEKNKWYRKLMGWADLYRQIQVRTNGETPSDAVQALAFGAEGIGLARTEHMFFDPDRIIHMREMILAESEAVRRAAVMKLLPFQKKDFVAIFNAMKGKPVTIRLLDPPLHEFIAMDDGQIKELASDMGLRPAAIKRRIAQLHELNPMLGHRGCRLGIAYPEITEMQATAILSAAAELLKRKKNVLPEIMIPLVGHENEFIHQARLVREVAEVVRKKFKLKKLPFKVGTMIEIPRACFVADRIAAEADFFSFGTNDLTQMGFGFSRDDVGTFLPIYLQQEILPRDPFAVLDQEGIGQLIEMAVARGRQRRPALKIGICGEHGGEPNSVKFCHRSGLDYVSCSPFRVPIARLAAAQAALEDPR